MSKTSGTQWHVPGGSPPPIAGRISAFLPCHNEEGNVERVVQAVVSTLESLGVPFEVIVVDDGSTDRTAELSRRLAKEDPRVRLTSHPRNPGYRAALRTGSAASCYPRTCPCGPTVRPSAPTRPGKLVPGGSPVEGFDGKPVPPQPPLPESLLTRMPTRNGAA
ncbi:MAG: glycosyltransferase family 2 protein [Armatimonadota bacterium]|nr:glycosyltransferase family 2 protein [Armatimonadota bacterium]